jgi:hypothetical protein
LCFQVADAAYYALGNFTLETRMLRPLLGALIGASLLLAPLAAPALAADSWLDHPIENWNAPGSPIPTAPADEEFFVDEQCLLGERPPETDADFALVNNGWHLFGHYESGWGITIVNATLGYDGMCRPSGFNQFFFVDGSFAGTVSPELMYARGDGAGQITSFYGPDLLLASYTRYADDDALCCPSLPESTLSFQVFRDGLGPVVVPANAVN